MGGGVAGAVASALASHLLRSRHGAAGDGCMSSIAVSTASVIARCGPRAAGWRPSWRAAAARSSVTGPRPRTGVCSRTDQTRIDVTAPRGRHGAPGIRLHRSRSLDAQDTTSHRGIPTTRRRTCSTWPPLWQRVSSLRGRASSLYDHRAIKRDRRATAPWTITPCDGAPWTRRAGGASGCATPAARAAAQRRLPRPRPRPLRARLPLAGTPSSSRPTAGTPIAPPSNDRAKDAALTAAGYRVLRFTNDVDPDLAVRRLRALLA